MLVVLFIWGLDVGMTVTLGWTELGILLETLTTLLLECGTRVLRVSVRVLCVEFTGVLISVCFVLSGGTSVLTVLGDTVLVKLDAFWIGELVGTTVTDVGSNVAEVRMTVAEDGFTVTEGVSIGVLLIPKVELARTNEELTTRALELGETVAVVLNTAVEVCNTSLDLTVLLMLIVVVRFCDFKVDVTKLEFNMGVVLVRLTSVDDITVLFPVNIAVVSSEVDLRTALVSVDIKLLMFIALLSADVTMLDNVTLVFGTATKVLALGSKMVEERRVDSLLGRMNEEVLVTLLLEPGTTDEELTTNTVDETVRVEIITCVVFDKILL